MRRFLLNSIIFCLAYFIGLNNSNTFLCGWWTLLISFIAIEAIDKFDGR